MTESQASILEKAKQGDPQAIAALLNRSFQSKGITAKASVKNNCFRIMLEAAKTPPQEQMVEFIRQAFTKLKVDTYAIVKIYGKCLNEEIPDWHEDLAIAPKVSLSPETLAKQGDVKAITILIKQWLDISDITVNASKKDDCLLVMLASVEVPDRLQTSSKIQTELRKLDVESVTKLKIYGKQIGEEFPDWHIETDIKKFEEDLVEDSNTLLAEVVVLPAQSIEPVLVELTESLPVKSPEFMPLPVKATDVNGYVLSNQIYELIDETCYRSLVSRSNLDGSIHDIALNYIENLESDLRLDFDQFTTGVIDLLRTSKVRIESSKIRNLMTEISTYDFNVLKPTIRDLENITRVILSTDFPENDDLKNFFKGVTDTLTNNTNSKSVQGAIIGGTIGTFFGPGVGTAIGSVVGSWIGGQVQTKDFQEIITRYDKVENKLISEWGLFLKKIFRKLTGLIAEETSLGFLTCEAIEKSIELYSKARDCATDEKNPSLLKALNLIDQAIAINSGSYQIWNIKGRTLTGLDRYEEAIASQNRAIEIKPDDHEAWDNRGYSLGNLGRYEEAIASYDNALNIKPDYHEAWDNRGDALFILGRNEEAISSYDKALEIKPDLDYIWYNRGNALDDLGKYEEAIVSYDKALSGNSDDFWILHSRGNALKSLGKYMAAMNSFNKALHVYEHPKLYRAYYSKALTYSLQNKLELALENLQQAIQLDPEGCPEEIKIHSDFDNIRHDPRFQSLIQSQKIASDQLGQNEETTKTTYDKAIAINPNDCQAWHNRGSVLFNLGKYEEAITAYDKAIEIQPDLHESWNNRGPALGKLGKYEEAIATYNKAIEIKPDFHEAWISRGYVLYELSRYEEAIASHDRALVIKPDFHQAWYNRGNALVNLSRYEEAIASYDKALEIKPDDPEVWYIRGIALDNLERYEEAIASYDKALEIMPDFHQAWYYRGSALFNLGRHEDAIASFSIAVQFKHDYQEALYNRGYVLYELGRYEEAIASYDKAIEVKPDFHQAWYIRGSALGNLGRYEEAIASFDRVLGIKPSDYEAWNNIGDALANLGRYKQAIASYDKALEIKPDNDELWKSRAIALRKLARYEEALASCEKALQINPENFTIYYSKARTYSLQNKLELALENLQQAIQLDPEGCPEVMKTHSDFYNIRNDPRFQALIQ